MWVRLSEWQIALRFPHINRSDRRSALKIMPERLPARCGLCEVAGCHTMDLATFGPCGIIITNQPMILSLSTLRYITKRKKSYCCKTLIPARIGLDDVRRKSAPSTHIVSCDRMACVAVRTEWILFVNSIGYATKHECEL